MARQRNNDRRKRNPLGVMRLKMNLDHQTMERLEAEDKVPRWINDSDTRIQDAMAGDYEFLNRAVSTGDNQEAVEEDRRIRKVVGKHKDGSPMYAYLMAIPRDYYEEDQRAKEEQNQKVDQAIRGGNPHGLAPHNVSPNQGGAYVKSVDYKP